MEIEDSWLVSIICADGSECVDRFEEIKNKLMSFFEGSVLLDRQNIFSISTSKYLDHLSLKRHFSKDSNICPKINLHSSTWIFDLDSTLINMEVIDEIAVYLGIEHQIKAITERAMRGEMDFTESFLKRISYFTDSKASEIWSYLKANIRYNLRAKKMANFLKKNGAKCYIISGGFSEIAEFVAADLGFDGAFANQIEILNDQITGLCKSVIDANGKAAIASRLKDDGHLIVVGDGANDLEMMKVADVAIAFNAKSIVRKQIPIQINNNDLGNVLLLFGYHIE